MCLSGQKWKKIVYKNDVFFYFSYRHIFKCADNLQKIFKDKHLV